MTREIASKRFLPSPQKLKKAKPARQVWLRRAVTLSVIMPSTRGKRGSVGKNSKISRRLKCVGTHPDVGNDENTVFVTKGQHPVAVAVSL